MIAVYKFDYITLWCGKMKWRPIVERLMGRRSATAISLLMACLCVFCGSAQSTGVIGQAQINQIEMEAKHTRDFETALQRIGELLKRDPKNAKAFLVAGQILEAKGFGNLAEELYAQADKCDPAGPGSNLQTFYLKLHEEGLKSAADYLGYVAERFPDDPGVLLMQGVIARTNGRYRDAEMFYTRARDSYPQMAGPRTALASLKLLQSKYKEALTLVDEELKYHPNDPAAIVAKGQLLLQFGNADASLPYLNKAYQFKTTSALVDKRTVSVLLMKANAAAGKPLEAVELGLQTLASTPTDDRKNMYYIKNQLYQLIKSSPDASQVLNLEERAERECNTMEQVATLRFGLGDVLDQLNHRAAAEVMFRKGLELMPMAARGHYRLGCSLTKDGDYMNGYIHVRQAFHVDPSDQAIVHAFVRMTDRLNNKKRDWAWEFKDWVRGTPTGELVMEQPLLYAPLNPQ